MISSVEALLGAGSVKLTSRSARPGGPRRRPAEH
jgi:hypothetical protein